jgi:hypothetical protein
VSIALPLANVAISFDMPGLLGRVNEIIYLLNTGDALTLNGNPQTYYTNATNLVDGTVPTARLGTGTANATTFLSGDQTWKAVPNANTTVSGVINTAAQSIAGVKTYAANAVFTHDISVTGNVSVSGQSAFTANVVFGNQVAVGGVLNAAAYRTTQSSATAATGVATTVFAFTSGAQGAYLVFGNLASATNDPANYNAVAIVCVDGTVAHITSIKAGGLLTLSLSGLNLQITQTSGVSQSVAAACIRII